jgi:hypothetical protein
MKILPVWELYCFKNSHILSLILIAFLRLGNAPTLSQKNLFKNTIKAPV